MNEHGLLDLFSRVKLLALDCDGVLTDASVLAGTGTRGSNLYATAGLTGIELARFNHKDGQGIDTLTKILGIPVIIISNQTSQYVEMRGNKIKAGRSDKIFAYFLNVKDKVKCLIDYLNANHPEIGLDEVCFVGDDLGDLNIMKVVGIPVTVQDGSDENKKLALYTTEKSGGNGAVREVCNLIRKARDRGIPAKRILRIFITGTGKKASEETLATVRQISNQLALEGFTILTNGGSVGIPKTAGKAVHEAIAQGAVSNSVAYTFMPNLSLEAAGTESIRYFGSYEERNGAVCDDADVALFFEGGLGTQAKLFQLLHRQVHINPNIRRADLYPLAKEKLILIHASFAPNDFAECQRRLGSGFTREHFDAVCFVNDGQEVMKKITDWKQRVLVSP